MRFLLPSLEPHATANKAVVIISNDISPETCNFLRTRFLSRHEIGNFEETIKNTILSVRASSSRGGRGFATLTKKGKWEKNVSKKRFWTWIRCDQKTSLKFHRSKGKSEFRLRCWPLHRLSTRVAGCDSDMLDDEGISEGDWSTACLATSLSAFLATILLRHCSHFLPSSLALMCSFDCFACCSCFLCLSWFAALFALLAVLASFLALP